MPPPGVAIHCRSDIASAKRLAGEIKAEGHDAAVFEADLTAADMDAAVGFGNDLDLQLGDVKVFDELAKRLQTARSRYGRSYCPHLLQQYSMNRAAVEMPEIVHPPSSPLTNALEVDSFPV